MENLERLPEVTGRHTSGNAPKIQLPSILYLEPLPSTTGTVSKREQFLFNNVVMVFKISQKYHNNLPFRLYKQLVVILGICTTVKLRIMLRRICFRVLIDIPEGWIYSRN